MTATPLSPRPRALKAAEVIASRLRSQIVRGELPTGHTLPPETALLETFDVSRPTLREAFRILETESLIDVRRGSRGGAQVTSPDLAAATRAVGILLQLRGTTIDDVYQARMFLEPPCARLLASQRTEQDLDDLTAILTSLAASENPDRVPDPHLWALLTFEFHDLLVSRVGNHTLALQSALLREIVTHHISARVETYSTHGDPQRFRRALRSYQRLIDLLAQRDGDAAEEHWRAHMSAAGGFLLEDTFKERPLVELFTKEARP